MLSAKSSSSVDEGGWNSVRNDRNRQSDYSSIKTTKLNVKPPAAEETTFGTSSDPPKEFRPEFKPSWTHGSSSRSENQRVSLDPTQTRDSLSIPSPVFASRTPTPPTLSSSTFIPISRTPTPPLTSSSSIDNRNSNLPVDEKKLRNLVKSLLDESSSSDVNLFMKNAQETIEDKFNTQSYPLLIEEALNSVLERKSDGKTTK
ncbi:phosphatase and actin regulator 4-A-like [Chelonus insularis]|uniref:phosphatase and actin regulator 4-A-like n=1 Tax=Chelonus insularis TaxID=460826 RepID=UPI00158DF2FF|nr:phosphatase and actin regulator 4-A-like [Chelonus insularis]